MFSKNIDAFITLLNGKGYIVHLAKDCDEAKNIGLKLIENGSVGFGDSMTVRDIGLHEALKENGNATHWHWKNEENAMECAMNADWYIASTNALTENGELINTDGMGNRVAGMFAGPKKVALFIGKNKLVPDIIAGLDRINNIASPQNGKRLGLNTPCAITGKCGKCSSPQRMCRVTTIIEYPPRMLSEMHLILIDQELGY